MTTLPDINAETHPFATVQHLLDQAAFFHMFSRPDPAAAAITAPGRPSAVIGFDVRQTLRHFDVRLEPPADGRGVGSRAVVGRRVATFRGRWLLMPDDFVALPGREPPPTVLEATRSQRFVILDGRCRFETGDGFTAFGTGRTLPSAAPAAGGPPLEAAAVGTLLEGGGKFAGLPGTLTWSGALDPERGFTGTFLCRAVDPRGSLCTEGEIPPPRREAAPEPGVIYLLFRGQKRDRSAHTEYLLTPGGGVEGLRLEQELRPVDLRFTTAGRRGLRAGVQLGAAIGTIRSRVFFNLLDPGAPGTDRAPIPFGSVNRFTFRDREGRAAGSFTASGGEGRTFALRLPQAPDQQALRFGAFQNVGEGEGQFAGCRGILTDNSAVGVQPHATATLYTVRFGGPLGAE